VLDLRLEQKIDGASGCLHSCMHCGEAQGDTIFRAPHAALLGCSVVGPVPLADFGLKLNWDALRDRLGVFHSVQNGTLIICPTRSVTGCSREHVPRN
jgi:hypothetical protein